MTDRLYLDHAATTPVLSEARVAMADALERWANPSSPHADGRAARAILEQARSAIAHELGWAGEVILTSGASEAIAIAAQRATVGRRVMGPTEHDVVRHFMRDDARQLTVGGDGLIDLESLDAGLRDGPALVAVQHVNNETGVIQPVEAIGARIRDQGSLWLADCAQSAGKLDLPDADFIAVSAHKLGGPPGIGALLVRDFATLRPSGGQEKGYRRGTQDVPGAAAFAAALTAGAFRSSMPALQRLRARWEEGVRDVGGVVIAETAPRLATIGAAALPGVSGEALVVQFDLAGIAISAGSACSSGSMKPSHVLEAMGVAAAVAGSTVRISFGPSTSDDDIDVFLAEFRRIAGRRRAA